MSIWMLRDNLWNDGEHVLDEDHGYFVSKEDAQHYADQQDHQENQRRYKRYVEITKQSDKRTLQLYNENLGKDTKANREHEALVAAGLRKPKAAPKPTRVLTYDKWLTSKTTMKSNRFEIVKVELNKGAS